MDTVFFVTNRPALGRGFGPPPACGPNDPLTFGTVSVQASNDPAKPGRMLAPAAWAGTCACGSGPIDPGLVTFLRSALAAAAKAGRTPLVTVHGYSYSYVDAVVRTGDLCAWLADGDFPADLQPILFTWPSIDGLSPENYLGDRGRAEASAQALARFVIAFEAAWEASGRPRALYLAHSMGTWATQNGMRALAASGHMLPEDLFEQAVIMGGDADTNALEPGQGLDELARIAQYLTVAVNRTDFATGVTSADILGRPRLGSSGPADPARLPGNARIVDYTMAIAADHTPTPPGETTWNYILHQYYRTVPAVREDLGAILSGGDPDAIENRWTSEQMVRAGQPYIQPGRLYLCPPARTSAMTVQADMNMAERRG